MTPAKGAEMEDVELVERGNRAISNGYMPAAARDLIRDLLSRITTLTAERDEALNRPRPDNPQRLVCKSPHLCFEYGEEATCYPCQIKRADAAEALATRLQGELDRRDAVSAAAWGDQRDEYSDAIDAAHPCETKAFETFDKALAMVSKRHGKYELVGLVNWLLADRDRLQSELNAAREGLRAAKARIAEDMMSYGGWFSAPDHNAVIERIDALLSDKGEDERPEPTPDASADDGGSCPWFPIETAPVSAKVRARSVRGLEFTGRTMGRGPRGRRGANMVEDVVTGLRHVCTHWQPAPSSQPSCPEGESA